MGVSQTQQLLDLKVGLEVNIWSQLHSFIVLFDAREAVAETGYLPLSIFLRLQLLDILVLQIKLSVQPTVSYILIFCQRISGWKWVLNTNLISFLSCLGVFFKCNHYSI